MSAYLVLPEDVRGDRAVLRGAEHRHLSRSARVRVGEAVRLSDGRGTLYDSVVTAVTREETRLRIMEKTFRERETPVPIALALAVLKGNRMDLAVEKATELGIWRIVPFISRNCVVRAAEGDPRRAARWSAIARAAAMQSERAWLPEVAPIAAFEGVLREASEHDLTVVLVERTDAPWPDLAAIRPRSLLIVVGPEGGLAPEEIAQATAAGLAPVSLGPRILRAETAAVAALAILQHRLGPLSDR